MILVVNNVSLSISKRKLRRFRRSGGTEGVYALDIPLYGLPCFPQTHSSLCIEPELRTVSEQPAQPQGHFRTDCTSLPQEFIH